MSSKRSQALSPPCTGRQLVAESASSFWDKSPRPEGLVLLPPLDGKHLTPLRASHALITNLKISNALPDAIELILRCLMTSLTHIFLDQTFATTSASLASPSPSRCHLLQDSVHCLALHSFFDHQGHVRRGARHHMPCCRQLASSLSITSLSAPASSRMSQDVPSC